MSKPQTMACWVACILMTVMTLTVVHADTEISTGLLKQKGAESVMDTTGEVYICESLPDSTLEVAYEPTYKATSGYEYTPEESEWLRLYGSMVMTRTYDFVKTRRVMPKALFEKIATSCRVLSSDVRANWESHYDFAVKNGLDPFFLLALHGETGYGKHLCARNNTFGWTDNANGFLNFGSLPQQYDFVYRNISARLEENATVYDLSKVYNNTDVWRNFMKDCMSTLVKNSDWREVMENC